jgi:steroid delta-isomerase-like uncharacterized protein
MLNDRGRESWSQLEWENVEVTARVYRDVWSEKRIDAIHEIYAPDFVSHFEFETAVGVDKWFERIYEPLVTAMPDLSVVAEEYVPRGNTVVSRWVATGTHAGNLLGVPPSHETIAIRGMLWAVVEKGHFVESWTQWNMSYLLKSVQTELSRLKGILSTCSRCKKICLSGHDDTVSASWVSIETYISERSEARFSHGMCPECYRAIYGDEAWRQYLSYTRSAKQNGA